MDNLQSVKVGVYRPCSGLPILPYPILGQARQSQTVCRRRGGASSSIGTPCEMKCSCPVPSRTVPSCPLSCLALSVFSLWARSTRHLAMLRRGMHGCVYDVYLQSICSRANGTQHPASCVPNGSHSRNATHAPLIDASRQAVPVPVPADGLNGECALDRPASASAGKGRG